MGAHEDEKCCFASFSKRAVQYNVSHSQLKVLRQLHGSLGSDDMIYPLNTKIETVSKTMLLRVIIISFLASVAISQGIHCGSQWGAFIEHNDTCMYWCVNYRLSPEERQYYEPSAPSFAEIRKECDNVDQAARLFGCTEADLVYQSDECECPYCKCSTENNIGSIEETILYGNRWDSSNDYFYSSGYVSRWVDGKICLHCTCSNATSQGIAINDLIYQCQILDAVDIDPEDWFSYRCPLVCDDPKYIFMGYDHDNLSVACDDERSCGYSGSVTGYGDKVSRRAGSSWFDTNTSCDTYCRCSSVGKNCSTGFDNIIGNDAVMESVFKERCGTFIRGVESIIEFA